MIMTELKNDIYVPDLIKYVNNVQNSLHVSRWWLQNPLRYLTNLPYQHTPCVCALVLHY